MSRIITAIVAMNADRVIGKDGGLPWHYSEDLKRFKRKTIDSTIIMGRKTWESIGSKPLPQRRNIVISSQDVKAVESYLSVAQALDHCEGDVWIIGGGQIYESSIPIIDVIDVTWIPDKIEGANLVKFSELNCEHWQPGQVVVNENDARLKHQMFTRR